MHVFLLTAMILSVIQRPLAGPQDSLVVAELRRLAITWGGHPGVAAKNLETGETVLLNADEKFPTASAIKFPVMTAFFAMAARGAVDPGMRVVLAEEDKKGGSGILQMLSAGTTITLLDAVKLMIVLSDNSATNLVLDRLAPTHAERMATVNTWLDSLGLKNTRLLNRLYSWQTKLQTPEAIRYGIGVSTPADMLTLLERLYARTLVDSASSEAMLAIMKNQMYNDMAPRFLPSGTCTTFAVAHKTGSVNETKVDVGLVLSDRVKFAYAVFVDKHPDHEEVIENRGLLFGAYAVRALWNHFTGDSGYTDRAVNASHVDWNAFPGGRWAIYRSAYAPFPHPDRMQGWKRGDGTFYPFAPHYNDSSIVVFVPEGLTEGEGGVNMIVHFHGHNNDNMGVLEQYRMPQAMIAAQTNALLVLPQGPYRARDSFGGKMEDPGGLQRLVHDVLLTMQREGVLAQPRLNHLIISAHSGGYRPAAFCLDRGGLNDHMTGLFLFDAFYGQHEFFNAWLEHGNGNMFCAYTEHLAKEHTQFAGAITPSARPRFHMTATSVDHDAVVQEFLPSWLKSLGGSWRIPTH